MKGEFAQILKNIKGYRDKIESLTDIILANLVMIAEIPAPTFKEKGRTDFLLNRFTEAGLQNCSTDEVGNGFGILPGSEKNTEKNIMVVAHLDSLFDASLDHTITIQPDHVTGPGVGDNATGLAVVASLPLILESLGISLKSNLLLMGSARSMGTGDIGGIRFFLSHTDIPVTAGICIEGVQLGRLSYNSIGMLRCEIKCHLPEKYDWTKFGASGAIVTMNSVVNRILAIPLPKQPRTNIVLGSISGGTSFNSIANNASLKLEIRSESDKLVEELGKKLGNIVEEVSALTDAEINLRIIARRKSGGIGFSHPLTERARRIMKELKIDHRITPSMSELTAFIDWGIPAITIGITNNENMEKETEMLQIKPISTGIAQLVALLLAIDGDCCD